MFLLQFCDKTRLNYPLKLLIPRWSVIIANPLFFRSKNFKIYYEVPRKFSFRNLEIQCLCLQKFKN